MRLKDIILSRKSHLERSSIGRFYSDGTLKMAEVQRWRTALWLPGMRAAGEETGCDCEAEELQRRWSSPVSAALHERKLDYTEPASVRRWPTTMHKLCRLYYSSSAAYLWNTVKGTQTSLTMLAPFYKALKRDIGVKNGS